MFARQRCADKACRRLWWSGNWYQDAMTRSCSRSSEYGTHKSRPDSGLGFQVKKNEVVLSLQALVDRKLVSGWDDPRLLTLAAFQNGAKCLFSIAWICTTSRRIPASASTNQRPEKGDSMHYRRWSRGSWYQAGMTRGCSRSLHSRMGPISFFNRLDLYRKSPDSGERKYKSRT